MQIDRARASEVSTKVDGELSAAERPETVMQLYAIRREVTVKGTMGLCPVRFLVSFPCSWYRAALIFHRFQSAPPRRRECPNYYCETTGL